MFETMFIIGCVFIALGAMAMIIAVDWRKRWPISLGFFAVAIFVWLVWMFSHTSGEIHIGPNVSKSDKAIVAVREIPLSKPVKTESVKVAATIQPSIEELESYGPKPPEPPAQTPPERQLLEQNQPSDTVSTQRPVHRHSGGDICSRSGGWKVVTHHGRSWHCAYARQ